MWNRVTEGIINYTHMVKLWPLVDKGGSLHIEINNFCQRTFGACEVLFFPRNGLADSIFIEEQKISDKRD